MVRADAGKQSDVHTATPGSPSPVWSFRRLQTSLHSSACSASRSRSHIGGPRDSGGQESSSAPSTYMPAAPSEEQQLVSDEMKEYACMYEDSLEKFRQAKFAEAREGFELCLGRRPRDRAAQKLHARVAKYVGPDGMDVEVSADWTRDRNYVESMNKK